MSKPDEGMKLYAAVARALSDNGIDTMFGLVGDANLYMADSFIRDCGGHFVAAANENGAVLAAIGYANFSGRVGVATVTHGPATTNTLTALAEGVRANLPIVLLCGDTAVADRDNFQNIAQRECILATGAGFEQLRTPQTAVADVAAAIRRAILERRPIALNMPVDLQWKTMAYAPVAVKFADNRSIVPESDDLDNAVGMIAAAKRPVILAGRGAADPVAKAALLRLAERIGAPVATTLKAKGLFGGEPFDLGICGTLSSSVAIEILLDCDCLIAFGAGLNTYTMSKGVLQEGRRIVQVDPNLAAIGANFPPAAGLVGDIARTADLIHHWLDEAEIPSSEYRDDAMRDKLSALDPVTDIPPVSPRYGLNLTEAMVRLNAAVPENRVLVCDGGRFIGQPWRLIDVPSDGRSYVHTTNFGSIGLGLSEAIGVGRAASGRPVLLVTGDGGFMLGGLAEFNTAVRDRTDLIVVVCNDGAYGAEHIQFRRKDMDPALSTFDWPDFAEVATALGGRGITVSQPDQLDAALALIAERDRPILINLILDPDGVPPLH